MADDKSLDEYYRLEKTRTRQWKKAPIWETEYRIVLAEEKFAHLPMLEQMLLIGRTMERAVAQMTTDIPQGSANSLQGRHEKTGLAESIVQLFARNSRFQTDYISSRRMPVTELDSTGFLQRLSSAFQSERDGHPVSLEDTTFLLVVHSPGA